MKGNDSVTHLHVELFDGLGGGADCVEEAVAVGRAHALSCVRVIEEKEQRRWR